MDTNTEPQINSFAGGLNSDDDLSVVATNQYIDARNIKISSYRGGEGRDNRHGSLMPVQGVKLAGSFAGDGNKVVATGSIRDYGVVVCIDENENRLKIYSFKNAIGGTVHDQDFNDIQKSKQLPHNLLSNQQQQLYYHQIKERSIRMYLIFSLIMRAKTILSYTWLIPNIL